LHSQSTAVAYLREGRLKDVEMVVPSHTVLLLHLVWNCVQCLRMSEWIEFNETDGDSRRFRCETSKGLCARTIFRKQSSRIRVAFQRRVCV